MVLHHSPDCSGNPAAAMALQNKALRATLEARSNVVFAAIAAADWNEKRVSAPYYFKNLKDSG